MNLDIKRALKIGETMNLNLPMAVDAYLHEVNHQGKIIRVGDIVIVQQAGETKMVEVSSIVKKQDHYWVGYDDNAQFCPWPLVRLKND